MIALYLLANAVAVASAATPPPKASGDKVRCVRRAETGSLIKRTKTCHTEREWARLRDNAQREGEAMRRPTYGTNGN